MDFRANVAWTVLLPEGTVIDTVFFTPDCNKTYVRDALVNHDGYPAQIIVQPQYPQTAAKRGLFSKWK